MSAMTKARSNW